MGEQKEGGEKAEPEKKAEAAAAGGGEGDKKKDGGGGGKKEDGVVEVKVDMHCVGCARKIRKAVKGLDGVERVRVDPSNNKMKVMGSIDPWKLKEFLEAYTKRKVEFISPKDPPKKKSDAPAATDVKKPDADKKSDDKPKPPPVSTVVLTMPLHCEGCIYRIKRTIYKIRGVDEVTVDAGKDLVTVKGTMDAKSLPAYLSRKFNRDVKIVPKPAAAPVGGDGGEKKEKEKGGDGGEKKEKEKGGDGGEKKEKEKGGDGGGGEKKEEKAGEKKGDEGGGEKKKDDGGGEKKGGEGAEKEAAAQPPAAPAPAAEVNKYEYFGGYGYRVEMIHPPQLFSDENPNACFVM